MRGACLWSSGHIQEMIHMDHMAQLDVRSVAKLLSAQPAAPTISATDTGRERRSGRDRQDMTFGHHRNRETTKRKVHVTLHTCTASGGGFLNKKQNQYEYSFSGPFMGSL